jgi:hypothetical protein
MLRRVALVRTDVSEEHGISFIRVTRIGELGTTLALTTTIATRLNIPDDAILVMGIWLQNIHVAKTKSMELISTGEANGDAPLENFPVFYFGSKRFVTAFTKDLDLYLSLA